MFTGITRGLFPVLSIKQRNGILSYIVELHENLMHDLNIGDSVAIDGVCQTISAIEDNRVQFDAIDETLIKTTLSELKLGQKVSVERAARIGDTLGGHELSGHILETGLIIDKQETGDNLTLLIQCSQTCMQFIVTKGFIALDGSSLTVGQVDKAKQRFCVHLIPFTRSITNFDSKHCSDRVNIEVDMKTKIIVEQLNEQLTAIYHRIDQLEIKLAELLAQDREKETL